MNTFMTVNYGWVEIETKPLTFVPELNGWCQYSRTVTYDENGEVTATSDWETYGVLRYDQPQPVSMLKRFINLFKDTNQ